MPGSSSDSGPIPPSPPSSAPERAEPVPGTALPLALAAAAGASSWNLFGAPFAIVTAIGALALALSRRAPPGAARTRLRVAAGIAAAALLVAIAVLVVAFRGAGPASVVPGAPTPQDAEASRLLDDAEQQSAERREAARRRLEGGGGPPDAGPGADR